MYFDHFSDGRQILCLLGAFYGSDSEQTNGSVTKVWEETALGEKKKLILIKIQDPFWEYLYFERWFPSFYPRRTALLVEFQPERHISMGDLFGVRDTLAKLLSLMPSAALSCPGRGPPRGGTQGQNNL